MCYDFTISIAQHSHKRKNKKKLTPSALTFDKSVAIKLRCPSAFLKSVHIQTSRAARSNLVRKLMRVGRNSREETSDDCIFKFTLVLHFYHLRWIDKASDHKEGTSASIAQLIEWYNKKYPHKEHEMSTQDTESDRQSTQTDTQNSAQSSTQTSQNNRNVRGPMPLIVVIEDFESFHPNIVMDIVNIFLSLLLFMFYVTPSTNVLATATNCTVF